MADNNFPGTNPTGANHPTTTHTTTSATKGESAGQGLKGMFAKGHVRSPVSSVLHTSLANHQKGIGESIRGNVNAAIDGFTGDDASLAKNERIARGGEQEFRQGDFVKKGTTDKAL